MRSKRTAFEVRVRQVHVDCDVHGDAADGVDAGAFAAALLPTERPLTAFPHDRYQI